MKKVISFVLALSMILSMNINAFALTDTYIFSDAVANTYVGQTEAKDMISNLQFTDTTNSAYRESIARMGAFDIVKGYGTTFNPTRNVTNEEALAFLMRSVGLEKQAQQNAATLLANTANTSLSNLWALGYLQEAQKQGLITNAQYQNALAEDQTTLGEGAFLRNATATREDIAMWIAMLENKLNANAFPIKSDLQKIYTYTDYQNIAADRVIYVETVTANGIMNQDTTTFNPKGGVSRGELASILKNLDSIYFAQNGLAKKTGTVGGINTSVTRTTGRYTGADQYYIRTNDGKIDVIEKQYNNNISPQVQGRDVVVYRNGVVGGLSSLREGDQIEYIVETTSKKNPNELTCYYIQVTNAGLQRETVFGKLEGVNKDAQQITIRDYKTDQTKTYYTASSMFGVNSNTNKPFMVMDKKLYEIDKLPFGSGVNLNLVNNIVADVEYVGEPTIINEVRGIVVENNPKFGYMVIYNNNGTKSTYNYDPGSLQTVKKREYYQTEDTVGYIDQVFTTGNYNPVNSTIDRIEAGDIVYIRPSSTDKTYIESISASPNYTTKAGTIKSFIDNGTTVNMLVQFDNGTQSFYTFPSSIPMTKDGKLINSSEIKVGDYGKILVNTAIITPGYVIETVKEIAVEGDYQNISAVVKGQLSNVDGIQKTVQIQNAQTLDKSGWKNFKQIGTYSLKDTPEVYYNGKKTDLAYASTYLKRGNNVVYMAIESSYSGDNIKKISIYDGRDTLLAADTIVNANNGALVLANNFQNITTDDGSIVIKNGKLVSPQNLTAYDFAQVSLNGGNKAAVINVTDKVVTDEVQISRGRVQSVDQGQSFTVQSLAQLSDGKWSVSAVARTYNIDYNTVYLTGEGEVTSIDKFIDYTADSVFGDVYNIVSFDGVYADYIIEAPYTKQPVRGTVYNVDGESVYLKDAMYLDTTTNTWKPVSRKDNTIVLTTYPNSIIIKDNKVSQVNKLQVGDQIDFYTTKLDYTNMTSGMAIDGYIIEVKN